MNRNTANRTRYTFLTVPVAVGAIILGPKGGAVCGLVFGITSLIQCFMGGSFGSMLLSINPVGTAVTCIVPRVLEGLLCGMVFQGIRKVSKNSAYFAASLACPLLNNLFFMSAVVLIFYHTEYIQGIAESMGASNALAFVAAFVGINGVIEAAACFVVGSAVSRALQTVLKTDEN